MDWFSDQAWAVWLGLAGLLAVAEMFSLDLVLVMLAVGAVGGMVAALLGAPVVLQVVVAALASVAMLAVVRPPLARRLHSGPELMLGHGKLVGQQGLVTEEVTPRQTGRIRVAGEIWSAAPYDDTLTIASGTTVEILQIKGATAYVHPVPQLDP